MAEPLDPEVLARLDSLPDGSLSSAEVRILTTVARDHAAWKAVRDRLGKVAESDPEAFYILDWLRRFAVEAEAGDTDG